MKLKFAGIVISFSVLLSSIIRADEGMWLPYLLKQMNEADMKKNGLKIPAEEIYSINKSSLKDAVVHFGGGCTAELISDKGLLLTNHHCGYGQIAAHSTVEKDYLTNGFWAMNQGEELACPGLTATIIIRMEDVTSKITEGIKLEMTEREKDSIKLINITKVEKEGRNGTHYESFVRPFFYGNQYILFITETFRDVRMVGAPPSFIGKFGGDTDNWVWPRHTGDFSVFRIYAGKDNKPADYSAENIPYVPKRSFKINIRGVKEGDFTMVYGFPGRTQEYLHSSAIDMIMNDQDPTRVNLREKRLAVMAEFMKADNATRIAYASQYASIANYWKKWKGEMLGLKKSNALQKKQEFEKTFLELVSTDPIKKEQFSKLFDEFQKSYEEFRVLSRQADYLNECIMAMGIFNMAKNFELLLNAQAKAKSTGKQDEYKKELQRNQNYVNNYSRNISIPLDEKLFSVMMDMYKKGVEKNLRVPALDSLINTCGDMAACAKKLYDASLFSKPEILKEILSNPDTKLSAIENDQVLRLYKKIMAYYNANVIPAYSMLDKKITANYRLYMQGLTEVYKNKKFYPDANSTLRITYGKVKGFTPRDGMIYNYYTTLDGMIEKEDPNDEDFIVFPRMKELYAKKDYGQYADKNGKLPISFLASNHTTGGNSGSPVLNAKGELIGTNYDRVWEGTMSDIMYNPDICRNITLDIRFTLFVIDKYAGAGYLLNEMKIIK